MPGWRVAYTGVPGEKNNAVAGLINFMRNIGSSVGTSLVTTILARRAQIHQETLGAHATVVNPKFQGTIQALAEKLMRAGLSGHEAPREALARIDQGLHAPTQTLRELVR